MTPPCPPPTENPCEKVNPHQSPSRSCRELDSGGIDPPLHLPPSLARIQILWQVLLAPSKLHQSTNASQAPTVSRGRATAHHLKALERVADPTIPRKVHRSENKVSDAFINSKRDKRLIKHSSFLSKIQKSRPQASKKRRRPSKKLVTTLESLADALPELSEEGDRDVEQLRQGKLRHKSLKTKPGALKRKERLMRREMARFGASLAQLTQVKEEIITEPIVDESIKSQEKEGMAIKEGKAPTNASGKDITTEAPRSSTANRWAALRGFISTTMEQNPAFPGKGQ